MGSEKGQCKRNTGHEKQCTELPTCYIQNARGGEASLFDGGRVDYPRAHYVKHNQPEVSVPRPCCLVSLHSSVSQGHASCP